jgi:LysM repeat protein
MRFFVRLLPFAPAVLLGAVLAGCSPEDPSAGDDEKEPHFVLGKSRINAMDYTGAVEAFQESLEVSPHSAAAHYQLACLYDTKISDPAAAIYHYQEFLRLDPKTEIADLIRRRIDGCKQQLATDVLQLPSTPAAQQQLEKLAEKNRALADQVDKLNAYVATLQAAAAKNPPPPAPNNFTAPPPTGSYTPDDISAPPPSSASKIKITPLPPQKIKPVKPRTHVVAERETMAAIARKAGVSLSALLAANPGVTPKKLRVGQVLNLP